MTDPVESLARSIAVEAHAGQVDKAGEQRRRAVDLMDEMLVSKARRLAESAHSGQLDKAGASYLGHVRRVADRVEGGVAKAVAWLHDSLEGSPLGEVDLMAAGMPAEVIEAVKAITHRRNEPRADYYERVKANPYALTVKLADVADNSDPARLALLPAEKRERLTVKYRKAREALGGER